MLHTTNVEEIRCAYHLQPVWTHNRELNSEHPPSGGHQASQRAQRHTIQHPRKRAARSTRRVRAPCRRRPVPTTAHKALLGQGRITGWGVAHGHGADFTGRGSLRGGAHGIRSRAWPWTLSPRLASNAQTAGLHRFRRRQVSASAPPRLAMGHHWKAREGMQIINANVVPNMSEKDCTQSKKPKHATQDKTTNVAMVAGASHSNARSRPEGRGNDAQFGVDIAALLPSLLGPRLDALREILCLTQRTCEPGSPTLDLDEHFLTPKHVQRAARALKWPLNSASKSRCFRLVAARNASISAWARLASSACSAFTCAAARGAKSATRTPHRGATRAAASDQTCHFLRHCVHIAFATGAVPSRTHVTRAPREQGRCACGDPSVRHAEASSSDGPRHCSDGLGCTWRVLLDGALNGGAVSPARSPHG